MTITALPTPPARTMSSDAFVAASDAFLGALPTFATEANALAVAMNLNSTTDTSVTSNTVGTGAKTFTVTAGKSFQPGMWLIIADTAAPSTNSILVQVTSYSGTSLVVNSVSYLGSGTKTAWIISQSNGESYAGSPSQTFSVAPATTGTHAVAGSQLFGFRNKIINGSMAVDQRNSGATVNVTSLVYTLDRMACQAIGGTAVIQRVSGSGSTRLRLQVTGAVGITNIYVSTRIEAALTYDMIGGNATLSVELSDSLLTTVGWVIYAPTVSDDFTSVTTVASGSFTVTATPTVYSATFAVTAAAAYGLQLTLAIGAQTSGTCTIGKMQIEAGSFATPFENRPYGLELSLCQRYYYKVKSAIAIEGNAAGAGGNSYQTITLPNMRATPTYTSAFASQINSASESIVLVSTNSAQCKIVSTAAGAFSANYSADNSFNAEL